MPAMAPTTRRLVVGACEERELGSFCCIHVAGLAKEGSSQPSSCTLPLPARSNRVGAIFCPPPAKITKILEHPLVIYPIMAATSSNPRPLSNMTAAATAAAAHTVRTNSTDSKHPVKSNHPISDRALSSNNTERCKEISCKRPSEPRSRAVGRGTIVRLRELQDGELDDGEIEDDSISETEGSAVSAPASFMNDPRRSGPVEVPLLSLVIKKRKGKAKGRSPCLTPTLGQIHNSDARDHFFFQIAMLDDWDFVSKPSSRAIIALEDNDQDFVDSWEPEYYIEPEQEWRYPLYSDVLRRGLEHMEESAERAVEC